MARELQRVLFAGGGTGGHVFMAVAIREALLAVRPEAECRFVGTPQGLETRILPPLAFPLETIAIGGLKNLGWTRQFRTVLQVPGSLWDSLRIVRRFQPDIVVGLGGYSSGPVGLAARLLRRPLLLIEPNVVPGLANRLLSRISQGAAFAFDETGRYFRRLKRRTGIPIRGEFHQIPAPSSEGPLRLLIFGGSRGSRPINRLFCAALPALRDLPLQIVHQTGSADYDEVKAAYRQLGVDADVSEFIEDMPQQFARCQLILSRSGASTIAEITASGRASILIPYPHAADDHQRRNAAALQERGVAEMLEEKTTTPERLAQLIGELASDPGRLVAMGNAARQLGRPDSAGEILRLMDDVVGGLS